ncbi:hypothetical protein Y032_0004g1882 [Ancylostoma ceylanicum]|nr:hypothetical protein Y032_0004g1882 [Ancylostoma ceylanicum]
MLFKAVSVFCLLFSAVSFPIRNENSCDCSCPGEDLNATVASVTEEPCDCSCDDPVFLIFVDANEVIDDNQTLEVNQSEPCPEGWKTFGSSCYYVETERLVYHEAEANCNEKGAELFAADSLAEWFEVMDFAPSFSWSWTAIFVEDDEVQWRGALDACELMLLFLFYYFVTPGESKKLPDVYWNSSNSLLEQHVSIGDALDIICPFYNPDVDFVDTEQSIIFRVPESDYESCTLSQAARELGRCVSPMKRDKVKISFRLLSPNPSALDYQPGHTYFFITTSTGTPWGLDNTQGGLCSTHQLKMIIHVGSYGHHNHRHHRKPTTTTVESPLDEPDWPSDPFWTDLFQKVQTVGDTVWSTIKRGERLSLDVGDERHGYESVHLDDDIEFQIHEIGDVESLFMSSAPVNSLTSLLVLLLIAVILRV